MKQYNFLYYDIRKLINDIPRLEHQLKGHNLHNSILHIYVAGFTKNHIDIFLKSLNKSLKDICTVGISEYPAHRSQNNCYININLIISENSCFDHFYLNCSRGEERNIARDFLTKIKHIDDIKAIEVCSANHLTNSQELIEILGAEYPNIPIFGALSKPARLQNNKPILLPDAFFIGDKTYTEGYYIIVYSGKNLQINLNYIQNWRAIGKELNIRLEQNPVIGASLVSQIDNNSAMDVYNKYLGIPNDQNFLKNAWYFPLIIKRGNINLCFTPIGSSGKNIYYSGKIYDNDVAHFAYCTQEEILQTSFEESKKIKNFQPEALLLIICCNRFALMRDDEKRELDYYKSCLDGMCYCHAFSEIAYKNKKGGVLNSALVSVSIRENSIQKLNKIPFFTPSKIHKTRSSIIPTSFIISHFFNEMTKDLESYQNNLEEKVQKITKENSNLSLHIVQTLAATIDAKDRYTNGHSSRVAQYSHKIAEIYGYNEKQLDEIYMIGLLHDVGKIGVPDYIINKKSKLTDDEYSVIKEHSEIGAYILGNIKEMPNLVTGARWHHERYDGSGYPDGLFGTNIPEIARIIAVADAYDAMTSNRSYRDILPQSYVRNEIQKGKSKQFDPVFADIMLKIIDDDFDYNLRELSDKNDYRLLQMKFELIEAPDNSDQAKHLSFSQLIDFGRSMPGGFFVYKAHEDEELLYVNDIVLDIFGCETTDEFKSLTGFTFQGMVYEKDIERVEKSILQQVEDSSKQLDYVEYRIRRKDGELRWVDDYGRLVNTIEFGDVYYVLIRDITDTHYERATLTDFDDLTKLYNKKHFDLIIHKKISDILHLGGNLCLVFFEIDYFNNFIELYGNSNGDECICSVAEIIHNSFHRKEDLIFRYGLCKFSILLSDTKIDAIVNIVEKILLSIRSLKIVHAGSPKKIITLSAGITLLDAQEASYLANPTSELIRLSDTALADAKRNGRDTIQVKKSEFCILPQNDIHR